jgi:hypothetical protein
MDGESVSRSGKYAVSHRFRIRRIQFVTVKWICPESILSYQIFEWNIHYAEKRQKNGLSQINMFSSYEFRKLVDSWRELIENLGNDL